MTLPNFLGIGVSHGGTAWLRRLFDSHPDIHLPANCNETHFFDRHFENGSIWYNTFFPEATPGADRRAVGEISTSYYRCRECPQRIQRLIPNTKLIMIIRNPLNRAHSHYDFYIRRRNYSGSFESFLASQPGAIEYGFYSTCINRYLRCFERSQLLILLFERAIADVVETQKTLADFLNVDASLFHAKRSLDAEYWSMHEQSMSSLSSRLKTQYSRIYREEFERLEQQHQLDLSCWRFDEIQKPVHSSLQREGTHS